MKDIENYWAQKEAEIGETIVAKFYCTYVSGDISIKGPLTGVLFFSSSTLFFQSFSSPKALDFLFQMRRREETPVTHLFKLSLKGSRCSYSELPKNLWRRLFAAPEQSFVVHLADGGPKTGNYRFRVDRKEIETIVNLINQ
jgi:hypothetical protein